MANQIETFEGSYGNPETSTETSDERLATLVHLQQLQQKQEDVQRMESETAEHANAGFRRGLEELVRDHLNTCMALASCSSSVLDPGMSSSSGGNVMSRHGSYNAMHDEPDDTRHSEIENDDIITAYNAAQSHGDILDSYENRGSHETEVQVFQRRDSAYCSSHHDVVEQDQSGYEHLDSDQFAQQQREADQSLVQDQLTAPERPRSRILSIWAAQHAQEMMTTMERQTREAELLALAGLHTVSTLDASFLRESLTSSDSTMIGEERQRRRPSSMVQMWRELEEERRTEGGRSEIVERLASSTGTTSSAEIVEFSQSSTMIGTIDEEETGGNQYEARVAHTQENNTEASVQAQDTGYTDWELNNMEGVRIDEHTQVSNEHPARNEEGEREHVRQIVQRLTTDNRMQTSDGQTRRSSWLDENERERVRELARAWVRVTNEQRVNMQEPGGMQRHQEHTRERALATQDESLSESPIQGLSRRERRFLNRQAILDLLMRVENERQRELERLVEHRAVSDFAHRHRLQSFLRGRFLRTGAVNDEERVSSSAAGELGQLRQRRAVSHMREGFRFRLESILQNQVNNRVDTEHANSRTPTRRRRRRTEERPPVQSQAQSTGRRWVSSGAVPRGLQENPAARRVTDFQSMEESSEYNMELQELLGRRSVTNVLASDFRERLDRLIRSFLQSQGGPQVGWDLPPRTGGSQRQQPPAPPPPPRQQWQRQQPTAAPPPPPPPPQPQWQQDLQQGLWPRPSPSLHRPSYLEGEGITDLRNDVSRLQQGMGDLHRMIETCLEMQLDLQRSLRQELAGALQQMYEGKAIPEEAIDGSKWVSVKRGICVVCCDRNIDSLLYRCGHMCTCLNCASELLKKSGKCPMCRAPIKEVVRAFTVA